MAALRPTSLQAPQARADYAPFGWSVAFGARKPAQVRADVRSLVEWASDRWCAYFPEQQGYRVEVCAPAGPSNGVQLAVRRGDFQACVAIESILNVPYASAGVLANPGRRPSSEWAVRMFGRAESGALRQAESSRYDVVHRYRRAGTAMGLASFLTICWLLFGMTAVTYLLGGLLMVVTGLLCLMAGGSVGGWVGEKIAEGAHLRALIEAEQDTRLQDDLRRWRALVRQLSTQRHALAAPGDRAPFRALDPADAAPVSRAALMRLSAPVLSFSSP